MTSEKRRTLLIFSWLAALYAGFRIVPGWGGDKLVFEKMNDPSGFRRLAGGESSTGFDPFFGLKPQSRSNLADVESRVRQNICASLYGETPSDGQPVPVAFFSDYYCPYCRVLTKRLSAIEARPDAGIRVIVHEWPLLGQAPTLAAKAALAARIQGAYAAFHERLMKTPFQVTPEYLRVLAQDIGIDQAKMFADMDSDSVIRDLENSAALARILAFIGTPGTVIGRTAIQGEVSEGTLLDVAAQEQEEGWTSVCRQT